MTRAAVALAGVAAVAAVLAFAVLAGVAFRGGAPSEDAEPARAPTSVAAPAAAPTTAPPMTAPPRAQGPRVRLRAADPDRLMFSRIPQAVGRLEPDTVLSMRVSGFPSFATAQARQCVVGAPARCGNAIPVQFAEDGTAAFQYLVHRDFASASGDACGVRGAPCSIVVENVDGEGRADLVTVFGGAVPEVGRIEATPGRGLRDGQIVQVTASGQQAGAPLVVEVCEVPPGSDAARCGGPGRSARVQAAADGMATAPLRVRCGPAAVCAVRVRSDAAVVRTRPLTLGFATPPGASYDGRRLGLALAAAAVLLGAATWFLRRTDWAPVGEVAAPEIDDAAYADLDAIVAAMPPEEDLTDAVSPGRR
jgi:hypothetical protein